MADMDLTIEQVAERLHKLSEKKFKGESTLPLYTTEEDASILTLDQVGIDSFDTLDLIMDYEDEYNVVLNDSQIAGAASYHEVLCLIMNTHNGVEACG